MNNKTITVKCPNCGKGALWSNENPWRPFCSERCKLIDLGAWANEEHKIEGDEAFPGEENDSEHY